MLLHTSNVGTVHQRSIGQRTQTGRQRNRQASLRCSRFDGAAALPLDKWYQHLPSRTATGSVDNDPAGRGVHWIPTRSPSRNHLSRPGFVRPARQDHRGSGAHLAAEAHPNQVSQEAQETVSDGQEIDSINLTGMQENLHILYWYQSRLLYNIPYHRPRLRRRRLPFPEYKSQDSSYAGRPKGTELPINPVKRRYTERTVVSCACANLQGLCHLGRHGALLREISRVDQTIRRRDWLRTGLHDLLSPASDGKCHQWWVLRLLVPGSQANTIIHQTIPILMRPSAIWSWITPTQPSSSATTCPAWSDTTPNPHTEAQRLERSWSTRPTGWADGSTPDDPKSWPRRRVQVSARRKKSRSFAAAEMNCSSAFDSNSRSSIVQRDKPSTISMRRPNELLIERSKR